VGVSASSLADGPQRLDHRPRRRCLLVAGAAKAKPPSAMADAMSVGAILFFIARVPDRRSAVGEVVGGLTFFARAMRTPRYR
jgi:hypothetical protein